MVVKSVCVILCFLFGSCVMVESVLVVEMVNDVSGIDASRDIVSTTATRMLMLELLINDLS